MKILFTVCMLFYALTSYSNKVFLTTYSYKNTDYGFGYQQRKNTEKAYDLSIKKEFKKANKILDEVIKFFESKYTDEYHIYIDPSASFDKSINTLYAKLQQASKDSKKHMDYIDDGSDKIKSYENYVKKGGKFNLFWLDDAYRIALFQKAFIAVELKELQLALNYLNKAIVINPTHPETYNEKGFILNTLKKPKLAVLVYLKNIELADAGNYKHEKAIALRGLGYSYIELGTLEGLKLAKKAYQDSLKIDPKSKIAIGELQFINKTLQKQKIQVKK
jgi:tetratricopeptide (TPR) repeat protein